METLCKSKNVVVAVVVVLLCVLSQHGVVAVSRDSLSSLSGSLLTDKVAEMGRTMSSSKILFDHGAEDDFFEEDLPVPDEQETKESLMELSSDTFRPPVLTKMQYAIRNIVAPASVSHSSSLSPHSPNQSKVQLLAGKVDSVISQAYEDMRIEQAKLAGTPVFVPEDPAAMPSRADRGLSTTNFLEIDLQTERHTIPAALIPDAADKNAGKAIAAPEVPGEMDIPMKISLKNNVISAKLVDDGSNKQSEVASPTPLTNMNTPPPPAAAAAGVNQNSVPNAWKLESMQQAGAEAIHNMQPQQQQQQQQQQQPAVVEKPPKFGSREWMDEENINALMKTATSGVSGLLREVDHRTGNAIIHADVDYRPDLMTESAAHRHQQPASGAQEAPAQAPAQGASEEPRPRYKSMSDSDIDSMIHRLSSTYKY